MIDSAWLGKHHPGLHFESVGGIVKRLWNPANPEQEMILYPERGQANVISYHCQQTFYRGEVEDSGSWDDDSKPWRTDWRSWRDEWLKAFSRGTMKHVRPGRDPGFLKRSGLWGALVGGTVCLALAQTINMVTRT